MTKVATGSQKQQRGRTMGTNTLNISKEQMMGLDMEWNDPLNDIDTLPWDEDAEGAENDELFEDEDY
ncbi:MAG: hypothetical protein ABFR63_08975 [Thermodesulfobacteriota bacterium]